MRPPLPPEFLRAPIAHRAYHDADDGRAENSPAAIEAAIAAGYGIEIDVQLTSDGVAVVFHDYGLSRLTGEKGQVRERTAEELARMPLSAGGGTIPTLAQCLDLVAGRVPLLVEIKDQDGGMGPNIGALERAVAIDLASYEGPVAVMSFNPHSMDALCNLAPTVPRGLTTSSWVPRNWSGVAVEVCERLRGIPDFDRVGASFISHEVGDLGRPRVAELKDQGVPVLCWTVRSPKAEAEARRVADNITFEGHAAEIPRA